MGTNSLTVDAVSGKWQKREKTKQRQNENSTLWCAAICCSCFIKISNRFITFPKSTITFPKSTITFPKSTITFSIFFTKTTITFPISFAKPPFSFTSITFSFSIPSNRITSNRISYRISSYRISYRITYWIPYRITCNRINCYNNHNNNNNNNIWSIFIWISSSFYPICQHFGQVFSLKSALVINRMKKIQILRAEENSGRNEEICSNYVLVVDLFA